MSILKLLNEVFSEVEKYTKSSGLYPVRYNIEVKYQDEWMGIFQPDKDTVITSLLSVLENISFPERIVIQSFNVDILNLLSSRAQAMATGLIIEPFEDVILKLSQLDVKPAHIAPWYGDVSAKMLGQMKAEKIKVLPWTVNEITDMQELINLGVNGIITDYPDRLLRLLGR